MISYTLFGNVKLRETKLSFPVLDVVYVSVSNFTSYSYPGGGGTPIHYLYGYVPPNGVVILKLLI